VTRRVRIAIETLQRQHFIAALGHKRSRDTALVSEALGCEDRQCVMSIGISPNG